MNLNTVYLCASSLNVLYTLLCLVLNAAQPTLRSTSFFNGSNCCDGTEKRKISKTNENND